ncbi:ThiF family adenylyltransferase [Pseudomaricurvus sp. HS19]|uniref:ThiF family adenylyltransferase n=1 Tax=Pseudomaricurvus sp. HS19 TaxID=2692626 RepID=UPI00137078DB|nr:thiamine biosynthesis protein ThiF [Pseudomaricurvus sp. HS19]
MTGFDYHEAFSRNIGWVTEAEQGILQAKTVAIAGLGGVGGSHLLTLARLGVGRFHISDMDVFELGNFNRQAGANLNTIGRPKIEVVAEMARAINPQVQIRQFPEGVKEENLDEFLEGVDLYIDGLDFFVLDIRRKVFGACYEKGVVALTAAPLGMGTAFLCFRPGGMSFEDYFCMEGRSEEERRLRFLIGLAPSVLQAAYLTDDSLVDMDNRKGPSTVMACELCAAVAATNSLKILLNRGKVVAAPWGLHFDAYRNRLKRTWRPWGNRNPIQVLLLLYARKRLHKPDKPSPQQNQPRNDAALTIADPVLGRILESARWAPSGDNTQPWRFEILGPRRLRIHSRDTRDWCVYDLQGRATQIALGALLETLDIAASAEQLKLEWRCQPGEDDQGLIVDVDLVDDPALSSSPWLPYVKSRTVQRRPLKTTALPAPIRERLEQAAGEDYKLVWMADRRSCWQMAKLLFLSAGLRLSIREGFEVHRQVIQWNARYSEDRIPDRAVGADPLTIRLMRWALQSWQRVSFMNRYLAGTWLPRFELDFLPGYFCGAHFILVAKNPGNTPEFYLQGGRAVQRVWLESHKLGLQFQPEMTPLIFAQYDQDGVSFTEDGAEAEKAALVREGLSSQLAAYLGDGDVSGAVFMGRMGYGKAPVSRSLRKPLQDLIVSNGKQAG